MNEYDADVFRRAGFEFVRKPAIGYTDDEFAKGYLEWGFKPPEEVAADAVFALEKMNLSPPASVLDIGCGNGVSVVKLAEMGFNVTGVDISPVFIEAGKNLAKERLESAKAGTTKWEVCDFFEFECPPHDAAILLDPGLPHADACFIGKLSEVLKPGGSFFLRYKQGLSGMSSFPRDKWEYRPDTAEFLLEKHSFDPVSGNNLGQWLIIDFLNKKITLGTAEGRVTLFSDFVDRMSASGFALAGTWADAQGSPVTENSRIYALFTKEGIL